MKIYTIFKFFGIMFKDKKEREGYNMRSLARVYIDILTKLITRNSKTFVVPKNKRNLNYDQVPSLVLI